MAALLGIGTATFLPGYGFAPGDRPDSRLLMDACARGVRYLDTAAAYGGSESAIGEAADQMTQLGVRVATKLQPEDGSVDACQTAMRASLSRLQMTSVDTVLLHSVSGPQIEGAGRSDGWASLREEGLARHLGASTYGAADACAAAAADWCDVVQVEFSLVNQSVVRALQERAPRSVELVVRSVLCKGLLASSAPSRPLPDGARTTVQALQAIADRAGTDISTLAIRFALDTPGVDVVLVGVSSRQELDASWRAASRPPLTASEYREIAALDRSDAEWAHPERWPEGRLVS